MNDRLVSTSFRNKEYSTQDEDFWYEYNAQGQIIKEYKGSISNWGKFVECITTLERDSNNRIIHAATVYSTGDFRNSDARITYVPNASFDIQNIKESDYSAYDKIETKYDEHGNWIQKTCYLNNSPKICYTRQIKYAGQ